MSTSPHEKKVPGHVNMSSLLQNTALTGPYCEEGGLLYHPEGVYFVIMTCIVPYIISFLPHKQINGLQILILVKILLLCEKK